MHCDDDVIDQTVLEQHGLKPDEYDRIRAAARPRAQPARARAVLGDVVGALQLQELARPSEDAADDRPARRAGSRARTPAPSTSATGMCAVFKIESHNHPSFIEPYQGAATGVGGIIRDIFTMGARPIALLNALRFGSLDTPLARRIFAGVVAGVGGYGNSIGIPTIGGEIYFDWRLRRQSAGQRALPRPRAQGRDRQGRGARRGQSGVLRRREDRPRRHPRRDDGVGRVRREVGGEASGRAGRRSVHGKAPDGGLPRGDEDRRRRRHSGHGRGRPDVRDQRDELARRHRHGRRGDARAAARNRHGALRDHAVRVAGAHAAGRREGPRARGRGGLREVGSARRRDRHGHRRPAACASSSAARSSPTCRRARSPTKARSIAGRWRAGVAAARAAAALRRARRAGRSAARRSTRCSLRR